ncbi:MAG: CHASE2 domain-containing protein [Candidatus Omnitrophota bacterium]
MKPLGIKKLSGPIILALIILPVFALSYFRLFDVYELGALDIRFLIRSTVPATDKVVIIEIGEDSLKKLGRFPFDRSYHAILIRALSDFGAKAIVFDLLFAEPQDNDREIEDAMRKAGNVYLPSAFDFDTKNVSKMISARGYVAKCQDNFLMLAKGSGHINIVPDKDGKFRRIPVYLRYGNAFYPYISFLVACDYLGIRESEIKLKPGKYLLFGKTGKIPLDDDSNMIINFSGRWGDVYKHYSYVDVLQSYFAYVSGQKPSIDPKVFKDKVCIIGLTAAGTGDLHPNPFETLYPGVGIHAEIFNSVLNNRFIQRASREMNLLILLVLGILVSLAALSMKPVKGLLSLIAIGAIFAGLSVGLFIKSGVWIDVVYPEAAMIFCYLGLTLYKYVAEWTKRLMVENELGIAKKIQESFLPKKLPEVNGMDIVAAMFTARQVGGDLYDFLNLGGGRLGVMIGDVSGKGVPASLFMAMVTGAFKFFTTPDSHPKDVLSRLNSKLVSESASNLFVTVFYTVFDNKKRTVTYSNGGHLPLIHMKQTGEADFLDVDIGTPLGLIEGDYAEKEAVFAPGDVFVFYTDGITEAMNEGSDMYGSERLSAVIKANKGLSSAKILDAIEKDVRAFEPKASQHDDMTLVVIKIV